MMLFAAAILTRVGAGDLNDSSVLGLACLPVCNLLERVEETSSTIRTIEFVIRARINRSLAWGSAAYDANIKRYLKLMEQGIVASSPEMFLTMASATIEPYTALAGWTPQTEENINDLAVLKQIYTSDGRYKDAAYIAKVQLTYM